MRGDAASDQCSAAFAEALGTTFFEALESFRQDLGRDSAGGSAETSLVTQWPMNLFFSCESLCFVIKRNETL